MFPGLMMRAGLFAALALALGGCAPAAPLSIDNPRIRELTPGRTTTAAYFTLYNASGSMRTLTGAESPLASSIEMHTMVERDGRVGMRRVLEVPIEDDASVDFAPGGLHLMVFGVASLREPFPITLKFADGTTVAAAFNKLGLVTGGTTE